MDNYCLDSVIDIRHVLRGFLEVWNIEHEGGQVESNGRDAVGGAVMLKGVIVVMVRRSPCIYLQTWIVRHLGGWGFLQRGVRRFAYMGTAL